MGSRDLTIPLLGLASTCYNRPKCQTWNVYLHSLWTYERRYTKCRNWGDLGQ